jgi:hypothetical protein
MLVCDRCGQDEEQVSIATWVDPENDPLIGYQDVTHLCLRCLRELDLMPDRPWGEATHA